MSKIISYRCDCCGTENELDSLIRLKLPIRINPIVKKNTVTMEPKKMDICTDCAKEIMFKYYEIAHRNSFSGIMGLRIDDEDDEVKNGD